MRALKCLSGDTSQLQDRGLMMRAVDEKRVAPLSVPRRSRHWPGNVLISDTSTRHDEDVSSTAVCAGSADGVGFIDLIHALTCLSKRGCTETHFHVLNIWSPDDATLAAPLCHMWMFWSPRTQEASQEVSIVVRVGLTSFHRSFHLQQMRLDLRAQTWHLTHLWLYCRRLFNVTCSSSPSNPWPIDNDVCWLL